MNAYQNTGLQHHGEPVDTPDEGEAAWEWFIWQASDALRLDLYDDFFSESRNRTAADALLHQKVMHEFRDYCKREAA